MTTKAAYALQEGKYASECNAENLLEAQRALLANIGQHWPPQNNQNNTAVRYHNLRQLHYSCGRIFKKRFSPAAIQTGSFERCCDSLPSSKMSQNANPRGCCPASSKDE
jgi:hypothetical protein